MSGSSRQHHHNTELQSAAIVSSGSGDVFIGGSFAPPPNIPINASNLPNRHRNFVGRQDEIRKVTDALTSRAWIVTIDGMGGIGKTTLALEVAHLCRERNTDYPHLPEFTGYIWTSARDRPDFCLEDVIREILYVLSPFETSTRPLDPPEQLSLATRALAAEPRLLIIDNFETVQDEPLHRFLRDQLPAPSKVLITSRHHIQTGERVITIGGLEENDAIRLLRLEAANLQIPLDEQDTARLRIIAQKSHGIPLVLRWVMKSVYNGKPLEWVLESLEHATAEDVFDHIFKRSLSTLDSETRSIFCSMSLLPTWARIETIAAMNPGIAAIPERVGHLVSLSLVDDNRSLFQGNRRYRLTSFAQYRASRDLAETDDRGRSTVQCALKHYLSSVQGLKPRGGPADEYVEMEFVNLNNVVQVASTLEDPSLSEQCIQLAEILGHLDYRRGRTLFGHLVDTINKANDAALALKLFKAMGNPYIVGAPVRPPMFFGRTELLRFIQETFESEPLHTPVISLVGSRRIGKTSLLYQLHYETSGRCLYAFIDLQAAAMVKDIAELLYYIAREIAQMLRHERIENSPEMAKLRRKDFVDQPYPAFDSYIENVLADLGALRLVLMIDEFDMLFDLGEQDRIDTGELLAYLRARTQRGAFGIITAGVTPLHKLPSSVSGSPFFNIAVSKRISCLEREAAIQLIQQPTYGLLKYEPPITEYLLRLSGCHPYLLQHLCYLIVKLCSEEGKLRVDSEVIEAVVTLVYEQVYFLHYLMEHLDETEQLVIRAAASLIETDKDTFTINQLRETLGQGEVALQVSQIKKSLESLVTREILEADNQRNYRFTMDIFRRWIVEEELPNLIQKTDPSIAINWSEQKIGDDENEHNRSRPR